MTATTSVKLPPLSFGSFEESILPVPFYLPGPSEVAVWDPLPQAVDRRITSDLSKGIFRSWKDYGPAKVNYAYIQFTHWGMDGKQAIGEFILHRDLARGVAQILSDLFDARFPIQQARLIDYWYMDGERSFTDDQADNRSMADNNSSALCVRPITGGGAPSKHAYCAVDFNTLINPYHNPGRGIIAPPEGAKYLDRSRVVPGMIHEGDTIVKLFDAQGWNWGGRWKDRVDYQHFEYPSELTLLKA